MINNVKFAAKWHQSSVEESIPQEVAAGGAKTHCHWAVISNQRLSSWLQRFEEIWFCAWCASQSDDRLSNDRAAVNQLSSDLLMTARKPETHWGRARALGGVCLYPCMFVCVRACAVTPVCPCYTFKIPAIFAAHSSSDCQGTESGGGRRLLGCMKMVSPCSRTLF